MNCKHTQITVNDHLGNFKEIRTYKGSINLVCLQNVKFADITGKVHKIDDYKGKLDYADDHDYNGTYMYKTTIGGDLMAGNKGNQIDCSGFEQGPEGVWTCEGGGWIKPCSQRMMLGGYAWSPYGAPCMDTSADPAITCDVNYNLGCIPPPGFK